MSQTPVFILSVSRSGSTLLQRVMAAHTGVATVSEPWLLLPLAYTLRRRGIDAEYLHESMVEALEDFAKQLPGGTAEYEQALRDLALDLYQRAAPTATHFVDKSPPYCLVAEEIMRLFPDGRFVFLWRNPLSIAASMIETWGPWRPTMFREDLFVGLPRLIAAYAANRDRVHAVRYERLVSGEQAPWRGLMAYTGIEFEPASLDGFAEVNLDGRMGDPTGLARYSALSTEPCEKWRTTLANPLRCEWSRRYLRLLGADSLALMGYELTALEAELDSLPATRSKLLGDLGRLVQDAAKEPVRVRTRGRRVGTPNVIRGLLAARAPARKNPARRAV